MPGGFYDAMRDEGLRPPESVEPGRLHCGNPFAIGRAEIVLEQAIWLTRWANVSDLREALLHVLSAHQCSLVPSRHGAWWRRLAGRGPRIETNQQRPQERTRVQWITRVLVWAGLRWNTGSGVVLAARKKIDPCLGMLCEV